MKEKTIKILHISDLHIQNGNMGFHNKVLDHIRKEKFSENIDYLVVSGDLGDKCEIANCKEAQKWLIKLVSALNISNDQVLFCQGNHDIQTGILEYDHSEKCYNYEIGRDYIGSPSLKKAFNQYEKINQKFGFSNASKISLTSKNDYIYETKDVRFIVINSSWLSQFNEKKMDDIKVKINTSKNKKKETQKFFNGVICNDSRYSENEPEKKYLKWTFNYNENTRQQVDYEILDYLKKIKKDNKLTILIQHHPEFCLHYLDHLPINGMIKSGKFAAIIQHSDIVLCGHIHPSLTIPIKDSRIEIPHFVGAACHLQPNEILIDKPKSKRDKNQILDSSIIETKPRFYYYELKKGLNQISYNRKIFTIDSNGAFNNSSISGLVELPINSIQTKSPLGIINKELEIKVVTNNFIKSYLKGLKKFLKESKIDSRMSNFHIQIPRTSYEVSDEMTKVVLNNEIYIFLDFIKVESLYIYKLATTKIEIFKEVNNFKLYKFVPRSIPNENIMYCPIIIDVLGSSSFFGYEQYLKRIINYLGSQSELFKFGGNSLVSFLYKMLGINVVTLIRNNYYNFFNINNIVIIEGEMLNKLKKSVIDLNLIFGEEMLLIPDIKVKILK